MHEDDLIDPDINKIYMGLGWDKYSQRSFKFVAEIILGGLFFL